MQSGNHGWPWSMQLEEQRRRAEADRLAAMTALEARSQEILAEKEAKRRLEARIAGLQSQLLLGGHKIEETPAFRSPPLYLLASIALLLMLTAA